MALIIRRHAGESIMIDDDIEIHVEKLNGSTVKLVIIAPKSRKIWRKEIYDNFDEHFAEKGGNNR